MKYILKNGDQIESIDIGKANIIIGQKNNRLTICDRAPNTKSKKARVICLCDCGQYTVINHQDFKNGQVKSCGCYAKEVHAEIGRKTAILNHSIIIIHFMNILNLQLLDLTGANKWYGKLNVENAIKNIQQSPKN